MVDFNSMLQEALAGQPIIEAQEQGRLLDAARAEFIVHGFQRASVGDIARRAKVSRPTLYRKLGDKDDIVAGVVVREVLQFLAAVQTVVAPLGSTEERVVEAFAIGMREVRENPLASALREFGMGSFSPYLTDSGQDAYQLLRTVAASQLTPDHAYSLAAAEQAIELLVRITVSLLITPTQVFPMETDEDAREFARTYFLPILDTARSSGQKS
jgi:AcrR family transcriptional regulator